MIAAIVTENDEGPCVVYWTGRKGLSVKVKTWCGDIADAGDGVIQIPDVAKICTKCKTYIEKGLPNL